MKKMINLNRYSQTVEAVHTHTHTNGCLNNREEKLEEASKLNTRINKKTHLVKVLPGVFLMFVALAIIMTGGMFVYLPSTAFGMSDEEAIDYLKTNPGGLITVNKMGATTNLIQTMAEETSTASSYSIGSNDYATLKEAIDSVADGGSATIVVTQDVVDSSEAIVPSNKTITIDTNGNTITKTVYTIVNDGNLSIIGGGRIIAGGSYTVTLNANDGTGGTESVIAIWETDMPSATMPSRTGYTFQGYYDDITDGTQYYTADGASARTWDKEENSTLYARWSANTYTISYTLNSGTAGSSAPTSGTFDTALTISNPTRTGYTFNGWNITGMDSVTHTYGTATTTATSLNNIKETSYKNLRATNGTVTFAAQWTANTYTISYTLNSGTAGSSAPTSGTFDTALTISNPTRTGYTFNGWNITGMDSVTHTYGTATTTATSLSNRKETSYKNLRGTNGTVTFAAQWTAYVAKIGSTYYLSVQAAINAATSGQTITVLTNSTEKLTMTNKNLTLNLNGKTLNTAISISGVYITINGSGTINNASYTSDHTISVNNGGILTINNVTVYNYATVDKCGIAAYNSSTALIYGCNVTATKYWALSCQNGSRMDYSTSSGHVTAKGGSVYGYALFLYGGGATFNTNSSATLQGGYKNDGDANYYVW